MELVRFRFDHGVPSAVARQAVREALNSWRVTYPADDVLLVATELVQNVKQHTDNGGELLLTLHRDTIMVEVTDADPRPPEPLSIDPRRPSGRGLILVTAMASRWGTRAVSWAGQAGKVVWVELSLIPAG